MSLFLTSFIFEKRVRLLFINPMAGLSAIRSLLMAILGWESYTDAASGRIVNNYYWQTRESMSY